MKFLNRPYYVSTLSAAALFCAAHQAPQEFFVITGYPVMRSTAKKGIKIRALDQRKKGRDLFDLYQALAILKPDPGIILSCYSTIWTLME